MSWLDYIIDRDPENDVPVVAPVAPVTIQSAPITATVSVPMASATVVPGA